MAQQNRERGTLQSTLPESPFLILSIYVLLCTGVATYTFEYSQYGETGANILNTISKASIGAISGVVGILYTDPFIYGFSFSLSMSCTIFIDELLAGQTPDMKLLQYLSPLLATFILSKSSIFKNTICSIAGSKMVLNEFNLLVICTIPLISLVLGFTQMTFRKEEYSMTYFPSVMIGITAFTMYHMYYSKHSHKNGGLVTKTQTGLAVVIAMTILYFVASLTQDYDVKKVLPFILGAMLATELGAFFAFVADFWYAVGTGQFLMVSLDSAGILFYFVSPLILLLIRFFDKYHDGIDGVTNYLAEQLSVPLEKMDVSMINASQLEKLYIVFITLPIVIGTPLIHYLCPITGYLFGRTYTHGDPNTKKVAICILFSDYKPILNKLVNGDKQYLTECVLNIFVSTDDLRNSTTMIKKLHQLGHNVGILLAPDAITASTKLKALCAQYESAVGMKPNWCHTGTGNKGNLPGHFRAASKLGLRCAIWSTLVDSSKTELSNSDSEAIKSDIIAHGGGSIFYLDKINYPEKHASIKILLSLFDVISQCGFKSASLSQISQENKMDL